jgi:hypothetical protein
VDGEIKFLSNDLLVAGISSSNEFTGTLASAETRYLVYIFYMVDANATVTLNGHTFTNVYKIRMVPGIRSSLTLPLTNTSETFELYYGKGVGLIYLKKTDNGVIKTEWQIRNWKVF